MVTKEYYITGKVREVGYRDFVKQLADNLGLTGIANHADVTGVKVIAQGDASCFEAFEQGLRFGPTMSFVKSINCKTVEKSAYYRSFQVEGMVLSTKLTETLEKVRQEIRENDTLALNKKRILYLSIRLV